MLLAVIIPIFGVLDGIELDFYCEMPGLNLVEANIIPKLDTLCFSSVFPNKKLV
jgi:hypothetical protein